MGQKKVLVIDDSSTMRGMIVSILEDLGDLEVVEVESGFEALRTLPRYQFDLIFTDINMPDLNGLELLSFVRRNPQYENTPVIIVTTEDSKTDRERGMALGANGYVTKPFQASDIVTIAQKFLGS